MTDFMDAIAVLNRASANAYARDGVDSLYGWAYSTAATRLYAAQASGEEVPKDCSYTFAHTRLWCGNSSCREE